MLSAFTIESPSLKLSAGSSQAPSQQASLPTGRRCACLRPATSMSISSPHSFITDEWPSVRVERAREQHRQHPPRGYGSEVSGRCCPPLQGRPRARLTPTVFPPLSSGMVAAAREAEAEHLYDGHAVRCGSSHQRGPHPSVAGIHRYSALQQQLYHLRMTLSGSPTPVRDHGFVRVRPSSSSSSSFQGRYLIRPSSKERR